MYSLPVTCGSDGSFWWEMILLMFGNVRFWWKFVVVKLLMIG